MTPAAFQYYLPLTLSAVSGWLDEADTLVDFLIFRMTPSEHGDTKSFTEERIGRLTDSQTKAVISTLEFLRQEHENQFIPGDIEKAISELQGRMGSNKRNLGEING